MWTLTRGGSTRRRAQNPDRRSLHDGSAYVRERRQHQNVVTSRAQLLRFHNLRSCSAKHAPRFYLNARAWSLTSRRSAHNRRPRGQNADRRALHEHRSGQNGHRSAKNGRRCASTISPRDDRHFARPEGWSEPFRARVFAEPALQRTDNGPAALPEHNKEEITHRTAHAASPD